MAVAERLTDVAFSLPTRSLRSRASLYLTAVFVAVETSFLKALIITEMDTVSIPNHPNESSLQRVAIANRRLPLENV